MLGNVHRMSGFLQEYAVPLVTNGYSVVPIKPRDKAPGAYYNDEWVNFAHWSEYCDRQPTDAELERWTSWPDGGIGIPCGRVVALDMDVPNPELAAHMRQYISETFGDDVLTRIGAAPKALFLFRTEDLQNPQKYRRSTAYRTADGAKNAIEVLGHGKQFVAFGVHPDGHAYAWEGLTPLDMDVDELPKLTEAQIDDIFATFDFCADLVDAAEMKRLSKDKAPATQDIDPLLKVGRPERAQKILDFLPNDDLHYDDWIKVGLAIVGALGKSDKAHAMWADWSAKAAKNDPALTEKEWENFDRSRVRAGMGTLVYLAKEHGWKEEDDEDPFELPEDVKAKDDLRFPPTYFHEAVGDDGIPWMIDGWLYQEGLTVIYGESGSGKSFFALDMGLKIAEGAAFAGEETQQGAVLYIAAEGGKSMERRVHGYRTYFDKHPNIPFAMVGAPVNFRDSKADMKEVVRTIQHVEETLGQPIKAVFVDTLARAFAGGNENSSEDMGAFVNNVDKLQHVFGGQVIVVHHTGKDKARGARGHSSLRAATDTEIEISLEGSYHRAKITKHRDHETGHVEDFGLTPITIGQDPRGKPITTCVVAFLDGFDDRFGGGKRSLSKNDILFLNTIRDMVPEGVWISVGELRKSMQQIWEKNTSSTFRSQWGATVGRLIKRGLIEFDDVDAHLRYVP